MTLLLAAVVFGTLFGFVLQRIGAADPHKIVGMLTLTDLHLAKTIMLAIGLSSSLLFLGLWMGVIEASHLSIKAMYTGVLIGGLLLGFGWALAGFCPGTSLVAAGAGRKDALSFVAGGLLGAGIFTLIYGSIEDTWLTKPLFGGKASLASASDYQWLAILIGVIFVGCAFALKDKLR